ncbi:hypothetical protein EZV62_024710 [Acer yangbiense]|uniref:Uncharacterized protein n=1 Tax=Acer yangbiense TaxID=1000413 RepID=A0A5C7GWG8_9ROSI|nr:hypothetical protein EZV62_024710 [Acer yangbiense]
MFIEAVDARRAPVFVFVMGERTFMFNGTSTFLGKRFEFGSFERDYISLKDLRDSTMHKVLSIIIIAALSVLWCSVLEALRVLRIGGFTCFALAVLRCSVSKALCVLHIGGFMYFALVVLRCSVSKALRVLCIGGFTYFALAVLRCSISEALCVLRIGGFTYFALTVLQCSISEALHVLRIGSFVCAPYRRLDVFHTGCASVLRIGGFICAPCIGCALVFCFGVLCSIWRDFFTQGVVLHFQSLYAPCLERLLHSRCCAPLSESLRSLLGETFALKVRCSAFKVFIFGGDCGDLAPLILQFRDASTSVTLPRTEPL